MNLWVCFLALVYSCLRTTSFFIFTTPSLSDSFVCLSAVRQTLTFLICVSVASLRSGRKYSKFLKVSQQQFSFLKLLFFFLVFSSSLMLAAVWISLSLLLQFINLFFSTLLVATCMAFTQRKLQHSFFSALTLKNNSLVLSV